MKVMNTFFQENEDAQITCLETEAPVGLLQPLLREVFPNWEHLFGEREATFWGGDYQFKVSYGKVWRRISLPAQYTLNALATMILSSFDITNDHLYLFQLRSATGRPMAIFHAAMEELPRVTEVKLGDLPIDIGGNFEFVFDLSNEIRFKICLEAISPESQGSRKARLLEGEGEIATQDPEDE